MKTKLLFIMLFFVNFINAQTANDLKMITAAYDGNLKTVTELLNAGANPNASDAEGYTALIYAAAYGYTDIMKILISKGAKINYMANDANAMFAAVKNDNPKAIQMLIDVGASVNCEDANGYSPLMLAAQEGYAKTVEFLISKGAKIDKETKNGHTALSIAVQNNHIEVVKALLKNNPKKRNYTCYGNSPLNAAEYTGNNYAKKLLKNYGMKKQLTTPTISSLSMGLGAQFSPLESLVNYEIGLHDNFYNIDFFTGISMNTDSALQNTKPNADYYHITGNIYFSLNETVNIFSINKFKFGIMLGAYYAPSMGRSLVNKDTKVNGLYGLAPGLSFLSSAYIIRINYNYSFNQNSPFYTQRISINANMRIFKFPNAKTNFSFADKTMYML